MGSLEFVKSFLLEKNVAVGPGETFGPSWDRSAGLAFTIGVDDMRDYILA